MFVHRGIRPHPMLRWELWHRNQTPAVLPVVEAVAISGGGSGGGNAGGDDGSGDGNGAGRHRIGDDVERHSHLTFGILGQFTLMASFCYTKTLFQSHHWHVLLAARINSSKYLKFLPLLPAHKFAESMLNQL